LELNFFNMESKNAWDELAKHWETLKGVHLRELLSDTKRNDKLRIEADNILYDFSHQKINEETITLLENLIKEKDVRKKVEKMFFGEKINITENRAVLHVALRAPADQNIIVDGKDVMPEIHEVLKNIEKFVAKVRGGEHTGHSGKALKNYVVVGIGGSYLSIDFVYEALKNLPIYQSAIKGRTLRFVANVDPMDFTRAVDGLDAEETLIIVNSKTFTTAETMLNARTLRKWLLDHYASKGADIANEETRNKITRAHIAASSTNLTETSKFGIASENVFGFWDWVGGRYSVWSAIGVLPLSLYFGSDVTKDFLRGGYEMDGHFFERSDFTKNIPMMMGALHWYQIAIAGDQSRAIIPYSEPLNKFVAHIQQLEMESNGKRVDRDGKPLKYEATVPHYGVPGTNSQHSFFQLLHQGRAAGIEFIGYCKAPNPIFLEGDPVSNQDELMSNFFAQPDALAFGRTLEEIKQAGTPENLQSHMFFPGDRASTCLLFEELNAFTLGQLLSMYEHRTVVSGFLWDVNSFDQYGVELGKVLGKNVRTFFQKNKPGEKPNFEGTNFNSATTKTLEWYLGRR